MNEQQVSSAVDAATSAPSTVATAGTAFLVGNFSQSDILFGLTALVLACQLVSWVYRFAKWARRKLK